MKIKLAIMLILTAAAIAAIGQSTNNANPNLVRTGWTTTNSAAAAAEALGGTNLYRALTNAGFSVSGSAGNFTYATNRAIGSFSTSGNDAFIGTNTTPFTRSTNGISMSQTNLNTFRVITEDSIGSGFGFVPADGSAGENHSRQTFDYTVDGALVGTGWLEYRSDGFHFSTPIDGAQLQNIGTNSMSAEAYAAFIGGGSADTNGLATTNMVNVRANTEGAASTNFTLGTSNLLRALIPTNFNAGAITGTVETLTVVTGSVGTLFVGGTNLTALLAAKHNTNWQQTASNVWAFGKPRALTNLFTKINVKDLGATGNGATDDWAAVQAAVNMVSNGTTIVYFPPGTYLLSQSLNIPNPTYGGQNRTILEGAGYYNSILTFTNATGAGINASGNADYPAYFTMRDLGVTGPGAQYASGSVPAEYANLAAVPYSTVGIYVGTNASFTNIGSGMSGYEIEITRCAVNYFYDGAEFQNMGGVYLQGNRMNYNARSNVRFKHADSSYVKDGFYSAMTVTNNTELIYNFFVLGTYQDAYGEWDSGAGSKIFENVECHDKAIYAQNARILVKGGQFEAASAINNSSVVPATNGVFFLDGQGSYTFEGCSIAAPGGGGTTNVIFNTINGASASLRTENLVMWDLSRSYHETLGQFPRLFRVVLNTSFPTFFPPYWTGGETGPSAVEDSETFYNAEIISTNNVKRLVHIPAGGASTLNVQTLRENGESFISLNLDSAFDRYGSPLLYFANTDGPSWKPLADCWPNVIGNALCYTVGMNAQSRIIFPPVVVPTLNNGLSVSNFVLEVPIMATNNFTNLLEFALFTQTNGAAAITSANGNWGYTNRNQVQLYRSSSLSFSSVSPTNSVVVSWGFGGGGTVTVPFYVVGEPKLKFIP